MTTIKIQIEEKKVEEFFKEIEKFVKENNIKEEELKIENLTINQYKKHFIIDSE